MRLCIKKYLLTNKYCENLQRQLAKFIKLFGEIYRAVSNTPKIGIFGFCQIVAIF